MARRRPHRLQVQLPFAAATLFSMLAVVLTLIAYDRVRQQSLDLASSRLIRLADQLAGSVSQSVPVLLRAARTAANHPTAVQLVRGDAAVDTAALNDVVRPVVGGETANSAVVLWDTSGHQVHTALAGDTMAAWISPPAAADSAELGPVRILADTLLYYELVAPIRDQGRLVGYLQRRSRVANNANTRQLVATLLGDSGLLLFGSSDGAWTDLRSLQDAPPPGAIGATEAVTYRRAGSERLGVGRAIAGTPWVLVAELPTSAVLAPSQAFLFQLAAVALLLVVIATMLAWGLGRRITLPLRSLAETASSIRSGDRARRAITRGHSELVAVNETFNDMADDNDRHIRALEVNEDRLHSLITATSKIVWWADEHGMVGDRTAGWCQFTGQSPDAARGEGWLDVVHPDDRERVRHAWFTAVQTGSDFDAEYRARRHDGEYRWLHSRSVPVLRADGTVREWIRAASDVTPTREMEARLERKEQELIQAQRLDAIGRLAGGIAHDFNNLLTAIIVPAELALEQLPPESAVRPDLEEIRDAGKRATALTGQLLAFGRQQVLTPAVVEFDTVIEAAGRIAKRLIPESIRMEFALHGDGRQVRVDPTQLEQVVINLVVNARDAMPAGGSLVLETAVEELDADDAARHQGVVPGRYLMLAVTDTGIGMDAETRERIFDPFFTTKEKGRGTGLGLATVYGIVRQSGGHIWLYSEPDRGTVVKIYLPEAPAGSVPAAQSTSAAVPSGTGTILFAEDDDALRRIGERMLRKLGYEVVVAADGEAALRLAEERGGRIDLLVTDMVMPGMGGAQLAEAIRQRWPAIPVLFLSGWTGDAVIRQRIFEGEVPFLQKPFTTESLGRKVHEILGDRPPG